ncbi:AraC-type DNA-binding protein [Bosea sp. 62]|uniref:helix-turn-helix domain-containing protein n=1 Tax=unclassified Bosea (in: a-proteobacteria) TaxID=2653178 RepID=UPI0012579260|nr:MULTISPECIES: AraC family transcriptional regulator [unclassified Bosea (in: a-proteobacteria)]CAD5251503.1 AraC-type DNA-binding protein [Bosea sp. 7B]CAD5280463.1 AraC-type DNA-binding protein [Bosea sp. 21B]CAD5281572.1 AraC-type DNA-binding protein [Bosea sp. 46]VVT59428.1 AraC-type DNA-binding protein [Bosea sp. EC-HK365B]VXB28679.1 AraC-type DNA-binding protein [Bosea sp. 62]
MSDALRIAHGAFGRVALLDMDRSLVRHAHPHCHVLLKVDGDDTQFLVGDHVAPLTDDLAVLVNAWETHAYVHDPSRKNALILALYIEPDWLRSFRPNWAASGSPGFFEHSAGEVSAHIRQTALDLAAEMVHEPGASRRQEELLSELMIAVIERFTPWRSIGASLREIARSSAVDFRVRRAISLMRSDPAAPLSIERLASEAGLSRAHFFRMFETSTGVTPHVFLNVLKVELAVGAVVDGDESFSAIGDRLGFSAPAHFTRFFRDHCSVAPSEFRNVARLGR